jgi:hypothetical protein
MDESAKPRKVVWSLLPGNGFFRAGVNGFLKELLGASGLAEDLGLFRLFIQGEAIFSYGCAGTAPGASFFIDDYCLCHCFSFPYCLGEKKD